jgi:hypothetical protein
MSERPRVQILPILLSVIFVSAMALLTGVLLDECGGGREAVAAYLKAVQGGAPVGEAVGGREAAALTAAFAAAEGFSVSNFQAQSGTACYWLKLDLPDGRQEAQLVLRERGEGYVVDTASLTRRCECPVDFEVECHLK